MREYLPRLTYVINHRLGNSYLTLARVLFFFFFQERLIALLVAGAIIMHDIFYCLSLKSSRETRGACVCPPRQPAR